MISSEPQQQFQDYLQIHSIQAVFTDLLNTITLQKPSDPIDFSIKYLKSLKENTLDQSQTAIPHKPDVFKKSFPLQLYKEIKDTIQPPYITLRDFYTMAQQNPKHITGLLAPNGQSYVYYRPLFQHFLGKNDHKSNSFAPSTHFFSELEAYIENIQIKVKRNVKLDYFSQKEEVLKLVLEKQKLPTKIVQGVTQMISPQYQLFVNKKEHLQFLFTQGKNVIKEINKSLHKVEQLGLDYDWNEDFGFLMHDTRYCGHGIKLKIQLKVPPHKQIKQNLKSLKQESNPDFIITNQENNSMNIKLKQTQNKNQDYLFKSIETFFKSLFKNIIQENTIPQIIIHSPPKKVNISKQEFKLSNIIQNLSNNLYIPQTHNTIYNAIFLIKRKFPSHVKPLQVFTQFIQQQKSLEADIYFLKDFGFQQQIKKIAELYMFFEYKLSSKLQAICVTDSFFILCDLDDHFIIVKIVQNHHLKKNLTELMELEQRIERIQPFCFDQEKGYGNGSELSVIYHLNTKQNEPQHFKVFEITVKQCINDKLQLRCNDIDSQTLEDFQKQVVQYLLKLKQEKVIFLSQFLKNDSAKVLKTYLNTLGISQNIKKQTKIQSLHLLDCYSEKMELQALCQQQYLVFFDIYLNYLDGHFKPTYEPHLEEVFSYDSQSSLVMKYSIGRNTTAQPFPYFQVDMEWMNVLLKNLESFQPKMLRAYDLLSLPEEHLPFNDTKHRPCVITFKDLPFVLWLNQQDHVRFIGECCLKDWNLHKEKIYAVMTACQLKWQYKQEFGFLSERAEGLGLNFTWRLKGQANSALKKFSQEKNLKYFENGNEFKIQSNGPAFQRKDANIIKEIEKLSS